LQISERSAPTSTRRSTFRTTREGLDEIRQPGIARWVFSSTIISVLEPGGSQEFSARTSFDEIRWVSQGLAGQANDMELWTLARSGCLGCHRFESISREPQGMKKGRAQHDRAAGLGCYQRPVECWRLSTCNWATSTWGTTSTRGIDQGDPCSPCGTASASGPTNPHAYPARPCTIAEWGGPAAVGRKWWLHPSTDKPGGVHSDEKCRRTSDDVIWQCRDSGNRPRSILIACGNFKTQ